MDLHTSAKPIDILLVEDNAGDIRLTQEVLRECKISNRLHVVRDGQAAIDFLRCPPQERTYSMPDLILLDLNLPKMDGREVLIEIKRDPVLRCIPVVVVTTSESEQDILASYRHYANCYIIKPLNLDQFSHVVKSIENFWFAIVKLPPKVTP